MEDGPKTESGHETDPQASFLRDAFAFLQDEISSWQRPTLAEVATVLVAAATVVVLMGALVYWLRAGNAGLPRVQTLTVIPQQEYVVVGMRQLVIPMLMISLLVLLSFGLGGAVGKWSAEREASVGGTTEGTVRKATARQAKDDRQARWFFLFLAVVALVFRPFDWTTGVLVASFVVYAFVTAGPPLGMGALVSLVVLIAFAIGLAEEADSGVRFEAASVRLENGKVVRGSYLAAKDGKTYLGSQGHIEGIPDRRVVRVKIDHPPQKGPDPPSLSSRLVGLIDEVL